MGKISCLNCVNFDPLATRHCCLCEHYTWEYQVNGVKCPYFTRKLFDYLKSVDTWLNGPEIRDKQIRIRRDREIARINQHLQTLDYYDLRKLFPEVKYKKRKKSLWDRFKESLT